MKQILIATDFSVAAKNATDYAAQLAKATAAPVILFHAWTLPVMTGETLAMPVTISDIEDEQEKAVEEECDRLQEKWGVRPSPLESAGFAADEIEDAAKKNHAGMVVMGSSPGPLGRLFGSVTSVFVHRTHFPALIVPEKTKFKAPKNILFATDLVTSEDWHELDRLYELARTFGAQIHLLNVLSESEIPAFRQSVAGIHLENRLKDVAHSWHFAGEKDIVEAIVKATKDTGADWIAVVPHRLPWLDGLFHRSVTKRLADETQVPLLVLPEKQA